MNHEKKFLELCGVTNLKEYKEPKRADEMQETGQYYLELYDEVESQGDLQLERVFNQLSRLLAEALQGPTRTKYGVAGAAAVKQVLVESRGKACQEVWERQRNLFLTSVRQMGLGPDQEEALSNFINLLPDLLTDTISNEAARLQLIPLENVNEITLILSEMFKEESHADPDRNN